MFGIHLLKDEVHGQAQEGPLSGSWKQSFKPELAHCSKDQERLREPARDSPLIGDCTDSLNEAKNARLRRDPVRGNAFSFDEYSTSSDLSSAL